MVKEKIVFSGSASNPPHLGHRVLVENLSRCERFSKVIWIPGGQRSDKDNCITPQDKITLTELTFPREWKEQQRTEIIICYDDVRVNNRPTIEWFNILSQKYPQSEIYFALGSDLVVPREEFGGKCEIEEKWVRGRELIDNQQYRFVVFTRPGYPSVKELFLSPQFESLPPEITFPNISSTEIREKIKRGEDFEDLMVAGATEYIKSKKLYF